MNVEDPSKAQEPGQPTGETPNLTNEELINKLLREEEIEVFGKTPEEKKSDQEEPEKMSQRERASELAKRDPQRAAAVVREWLKEEKKPDQEPAPQTPPSFGASEGAPATEEFSEEEVKAEAQKIFDERMSGTYKVSGEEIDKMLQERGLTPWTPEAEEFMRNWDWEQAKAVLKARKEAETSKEVLERAETLSTFTNPKYENSRALFGAIREHVYQEKRTNEERKKELQNLGYDPEQLEVLGKKLRERNEELIEKMKESADKGQELSPEEGKEYRQLQGLLYSRVKLPGGGLDLEQHSDLSVGLASEIAARARRLVSVVAEADPQKRKDALGADAATITWDAQDLSREKEFLRLGQEDETAYGERLQELLDFVASPEEKKQYEALLGFLEGGSAPKEDAPEAPEEAERLAQKHKEREASLEEVALLLELQSQREHFAPIEQEYRDELRKRLGTLPENKEAAQKLTEKVAAELPEDLRTRYEEAKAAYGKAKQECIDYRLKAIQEKSLSEDEKNQERGGFLTQFIYEEVGRFQERQELARSEKDQGLLRNWAGSLVRGMARLPGPARWAASGVIGGAAVLGVTFGLGITAPVAGLGIAGYLGVRVGRSVLGGVSGYYAGRLTKRLTETYRKEHGLTEEGARQEVGRVIQEQNQELMAGAVEQVVARGEQALVARLERIRKAKGWGKGFEVLSAFLAGGLASLGTGYAVEAATLGGKVMGVSSEELERFRQGRVERWQQAGGETIRPVLTPEEMVTPGAVEPPPSGAAPVPETATAPRPGGTGPPGGAEAVPAAPAESELLGALTVEKDQNPLLLAKRIYAEHAPRIGYSEDVEKMYVSEAQARGYKGDIGNAEKVKTWALQKWATDASTRHVVGQYLIEHRGDDEFAKAFFEKHQDLLVNGEAPKTHADIDKISTHLKQDEFESIVKNKVPNLVHEGDRIEADQYGNIRAVNKDGKVLLGHIQERPKGAAAEAGASTTKETGRAGGESPAAQKEGPGATPEAAGETPLDDYGNTFKKVTRLINGQERTFYVGELRHLPQHLRGRAPEGIGFVAEFDNPGDPYREISVYDLDVKTPKGDPTRIARLTPDRLGLTAKAPRGEFLEKMMDATHGRLQTIDRLTGLLVRDRDTVVTIVSNLERGGSTTWSYQIDGKTFSYIVDASRGNFTLALQEHPSPFSGEPLRLTLGKQLEDVLKIREQGYSLKRLSDAAEALKGQIQGYQLDKPLEDVLEMPWKDVVAQANAWKGLQEGYVPESRTSHGGFMEWLLHQVSGLEKAGKIKVDPADQLKNVLDEMARARV